MAKKKSTNLSLSDEHKRRLVVLKTRLTRNSQTNVVEHLIDEKWAALDLDALKIHTSFKQ
jgi:predicted DNA-binding protein